MQDKTIALSPSAMPDHASLRSNFETPAMSGEDMDLTYHKDHNSDSENNNSDSENVELTKNVTKRNSNRNTSLLDTNDVHKHKVIIQSSDSIVPPLRFDDEDEQTIVGKCFICQSCDELSQLNNDKFICSYCTEYKCKTCFICHVEKKYDLENQLVFCKERELYICYECNTETITVNKKELALFMYTMQKSNYENVFYKTEKNAVDFFSQFWHNKHELFDNSSANKDSVEESQYRSEQQTNINSSARIEAPEEQQQQEQEIEQEDSDDVENTLTKSKSKSFAQNSDCAIAKILFRNSTNECTVLIETEIIFPTEQSKFEEYLIEVAKMFSNLKKNKKKIQYYLEQLQCYFLFICLKAKHADDIHNFLHGRHMKLDQSDMLPIYESIFDKLPARKRNTLGTKVLESLNIGYAIYVLNEKIFRFKHPIAYFEMRQKFVRTLGSQLRSKLNYCNFLKSSRAAYSDRVVPGEDMYDSHHEDENAQDNMEEDE